MSGVKIGLKDLHYAKLVQDDSGGVVYETPQPLAKSISATITPSTDSQTLYADDGPAETVNSLGSVEVSLNISDLPLNVQAALLGGTINANGELVNKSTDTAPYVAILFRSLKTDGKYRYVKLLKGRFQEPEDSNETKTDTTTFSTPTITGTFVRREYDDHWRRMADEGENGFTGAATWFDSVE